MSWRPALVGAAAAAGLLVFYLGLITLAQGWQHAVEQLAGDRWFVLAILVGFGTQVGLFVILRGRHARHGGAVAGGVAASTGTSTAAMLACCAHHLTDVLAVIGLAGAAAVLTEYKPLLLWSGIAMNLAGASYLAWQIRRVTPAPRRVTPAPRRVRQPGQPGASGQPPPAGGSGIGCHVR